MTSHTITHFCYEKNGKEITVAVTHPVVDPHRKEAIDYFVANGCRFAVDSESNSRWASNLDHELQELIVKDHLELLSLYSLRIPDTASIRSDNLVLLSTLSDVKHLYIATEKIRAGDMRFLCGLPNLEVLTLIGQGFVDDHVFNLPKMTNIRMIDIQTTAVTEPVANQLRHEYPSAKIYH